MSVKILALMCGKVQDLGQSGRQSAINKTIVDEPLELSETGFIKDQQADLKNHGGLEKAVHHYPYDHYAFWKEELENQPSCLNNYGAFGENISTLGMTEDTVCIGDIYQIGDCQLEVSQARQPCWKLNYRFENKHMSRTLQNKGYTGWYYRVLKTGTITAGDEIKLINRPHPDWPLSKLIDALYIDTLNLEKLQAMVEMKALAESWKKIARRRLEKIEVEDWNNRLEGN